MNVEPAPNVTGANEGDTTLLEVCKTALRAIGVEVTEPIPVLMNVGWSESDQIEALARSYQIRVRRIRLPSTQWTLDGGAVIAFRNEGTRRMPIALLPQTRIGTKFSGALESMAYFLQHPLPTGSLHLRDLLVAAVAGGRRDGIGTLFIAFVAGVLGFAPPALTAIIFDRIVPTSQYDVLIAFLLVMLIIVTSIQIFDFFSALLRLRLQSRVSHTLKARLMDRILSLPTDFFRRFAIGNLLTRAGIADSEQERLLISSATGFLSGLFSTSNLVVLLWFDLRIGLISLGAGLSVLLIAFWSGRRKMHLERELLEKTTQLRSLLFQILSGISKVRASGAEARLFSRWSKAFRERQLLGFASSRLSNAVAVFHSFVPLVCTAAFFWILGTVGPGVVRVPPGRYLAVFTTFALFMTGMSRLAGAIADLASAIPRLERVRPLLLAPLERSHRGREPGELSGGVTLENLSFRYSPESPLVLNDLNIDIEPGQFAALVGPSGSGKTSLVRLLLGFEQPHSGRILYDGVSLAELDVFQVRRQIGTVLQHDHLISGNIYENIAAVRPITLEQAWEAARIAGLEQDLARMPMGMHSFVTPGGRTYSGGERQRVMIARAVAGKPRLLIFDEATSALDNRVQAEVMQNLEKLKITRIVVAHRLSTIRSADLILVFDRGRIVERGDFTSLIARDGVFAQLARRQST